MGDELDPANRVEAEAEIEDDPLAELARIVAGEPEPESDPEPVNEKLADQSDDHEELSVDAEIEQSENVEPEASVDSEQALEDPSHSSEDEAPSIAEQEDDVVEPEAIQNVKSALEDVERELEAAMAFEETENDVTDDALAEEDDEDETSNEVAAELDEVDPFADLEEELAQAIGDEDTTQDTDESVQADSEPAAALVKEAETDEPKEVSFQDDLISALEDEISKGPEQDVEMSNQLGEELDNTEASEVVEEDTLKAVTEPEEWFEDELRKSLDDETEFASEGDVEAEEDTTTSIGLSDEQATQENEEAETAVETKDEPQEEADSTSHSLDDDLGAAFASEFEQMQSKAPTEDDSVFADLAAIEEPSSSAPTISEIPDAPQTLTQKPESEPASIDAGELDFGAAFAEELGVDTIAEADASAEASAATGWGNDDTDAASADFAAAVNRENEEARVGVIEDVPAMDGDPGHVGTLAAADAAQEQSKAESGTGGGSKKYAFIAFAIALLAGSVVTVYGFLGSGDPTPNSSAPTLIVADSEPFKVEPEDPGGRVPANQDKASYEKVEGNDTNQVDQETLISNVEEPAELGDDRLTAVEDPESNLAPKTDERLAAGGEAPEADTNSSSTVTPRVVQTVTVKPDGTIVTGEPIPAPQIPEVPEVPEVPAAPAVPATTEVASNTATEGVVATPKPVEIVTIKKPEAIDGAKTTGDLAIPVASPLPKPAPKPAPTPQPVQTAAATQVEQQPAAPASVRKSEWVVQVSSQRSPEAAQASFQNLRNRFSSLQGRAMAIQRANVNGSTFYRVRVQTESRADANTLCNSLKASGGSCFVTR
ncbi:MAG: SPOR domain-containing protein [Pseudomonadota bacterium]